MTGLGRYPWFWTSLIAILVYSDVRALSGGWVYDDAGSVIKNVVVNGMVDWKEAFTRDYWGTEMKQTQSHKSFRPITTLTLKANYVLGHYLDGEKTKEQQEQNKQNLPPTWTFHAVNILLHGIVTGLVTKATSYVLPSEDIVSQLVVGSLFAVHPVHAEVVSNITSRGEMLMSVFFLIAFLSFAGTRRVCHEREQLQHRQSSFIQLHQQQHRQQQQQQLFFLWQRLWGIYLLPWLCMTLSLFSKEQGATTLISVVAWDFLKYHGNLVSLQRKLFLSVDEKKKEEHSRRKDENDEVTQSDGDDDHDHDDGTAAIVLATAKRERAEAWQFVGRTLVLAVQTLIVVAWRYVLNGESSPDFIVAQNPAGFAEDRFTRAFSVTWIYCLYIRDALYPYYLSPDWSGHSIDLITNLRDPRAMAVLALWYFAAQSFWTMIVGADTTSNSSSSSSKSKSNSTSNQGAKNASNDGTANNWYWNETTLRQVNTAIWAFAFSPFLLSSNILVVVGLMKADRVIYLPLFGFCLLEALLISKFLKGAVTMRPAFERRKEQLFWGAHFFLMFQLIVFSGRTHDRNLAWSHSLR